MTMAQLHDIGSAGVGATSFLLKRHLEWLSVKILVACSSIAHRPADMRRE